MGNEDDVFFGSHIVERVCRDRSILRGTLAVETHLNFAGLNRVFMTGYESANGVESLLRSLLDKSPGHGVARCAE